VFEPRVTIAGKPYDVRYAWIWSSPPALLALYGLSRLERIAFDAQPSVDLAVVLRRC